MSGLPRCLPLRVVKQFQGPNGMWVTLWEIEGSYSELPFILFSQSLN